MQRLQKIGARGFLLLLCAQPGCPRPTSPRPVPRTPSVLGAPQLSGIWVGTRRDLVPGGVHRRVSVLWSLKASPGSGRLTGEMQLSGALSTGYRGVLPCNQLPSAAIVRNAEITDGRFTPH